MHVRLTHYEDDRLKVDYSYDALGRRLSKHSQAYYEERREAGPHWNRAERVKRNRELQCGFTLYGWDGDTLAWESKIADEDGFGACTTHYVYEPGSFVPVAQAVRGEAIELLDQPEYGDYYRQDEDPLWGPPPSAPPITSLAWYQCDHLGTPQELTDEHSEIAWSAEYRAWGVAQEAIRKASGKALIANPIRFQGQYHDHESGLHYNRYRYYDPEVGRFVSRDPIGFAGGINNHVYTVNPITNTDALGLQAQPSYSAAGYDQNDGYYHYYMMKTELCEVNSCPTCTAGNAWRSLKKHPAPGWNSNAEVKSGNETPINFLGLSGGTVTHTVDESQMKLFNYTQSDHIFSAGQVERSIVVENNRIFVKSVGEGITSAGSWYGIPRSVRGLLNMKLYKPGFDSLDGKIKSEVCGK